MKNILNAYRNTTNLPAEDAYKFLYQHRREIVEKYGRNTFSEMVLNYRTYYKKSSKQKIFDGYKKYVMSKTDAHKSDLSIGYNIVNQVILPEDQEQLIVDYMFNRLQDQFPKSIRSNYKLKKYFVLDYIEKNILTRKKHDNNS
jgi:hypothetical protein